MHVKTEPCPDIPGTFVTIAPPWEKGFTVNMRSGRVIQLAKLHQFETYDELLDGYPHARLNERILNKAISASQHWANAMFANNLFSRPCLLPQRTRRCLFDIHGPATKEYGECEALPAITTFAIFHSSSLGDANPYSSLSFVWFQAAWGLPPKQIVKYISNIDWDALAKGWNW
jgi:hypothetical protein